MALARGDSNVYRRGARMADGMPGDRSPQGGAVSLSDESPHECETSRCWSECQKARSCDDVPTDARWDVGCELGRCVVKQVTLSPGLVACFCGWSAGGGDEGWRIAAFAEHAKNSHTTEQRERGVLAAVRRGLDRIRYIGRD